MRYDTPVYFQTIKSEFDSTTHNTGISVLTEESRYASVTDSGTDTLRLVYGGIKQGSKTIRLQRPYEKPFDRIRIGEKVYQVDFSRKDRNFVVSGVT